MPSIQMSGTERFFFDLGFGKPEKTESLVIVLGHSRFLSMAESIIRTLDTAQEVLVFQHRYGVGHTAKTVADILPLLVLPTPSVTAVHKIIKKLVKKLRAPSRIDIVLNEIKDIPY